ncbi:hypothetical protein [Streptomyces sp. TRM70350]|uniref:hypothetical protein n=1 Tax=Streptomyces sp. TRM70350 TaxID=2856165 RepID=UPI001C455CD2|nr:hypothetical protein [Streptomyces sp. TRM70350]MBV7698659.1 hypothetical protein [Streptomyces sp. TRM70350]
MVIRTGRYAGTHSGRIAVRSTGRHRVTTSTGQRIDTRHPNIRLLQRADGYSYKIKHEVEAIDIHRTSSSLRGSAPSRR